MVYRPRIDRIDTAVILGETIDGMMGWFGTGSVYVRLFEYVSFRHPYKCPHGVNPASPHQRSPRLAIADRRVNRPTVAARGDAYDHSYG